MERGMERGMESESEMKRERERERETLTLVRFRLLVVFRGISADSFGSVET